MKLEKITELSRAILNRECRFDGSVVGKIIAIEPLNEQTIVERYDNYGHTASEYDYLLSQGYEFLMDKHEFEEFRKKSNLYYVHIDEIDGIIISDEYPKIIITVDKDNKIAINKQ